MMVDSNWDTLALFLLDAKTSMSNTYHKFRYKPDNWNVW